MKNGNTKGKIFIFVGFLLLAAAFVFIASRRTYEIKGDMVFVKTPQAITTLQKTGDFTQEAYLLVGEGLNSNDYYVAEIPVIPKGEVDALNREFGDFRKCANAGASAGKENVIGLRMIGINDEIDGKILEVFERSQKMDGEYLIRVDGAPLQIIDHQIRSNRARNLVNNPHEDLLVRDVEMIKVSL